MANSDSTRSTVGRPRSTRTHSLICDAVLDLVSRGESLSSISLVAVAQTAGVSRNSIYRRWKSKEQLYSDVVTSMKRELPEPTELSARENLIALMDVRSEEGDGRYIRRMEQAIVAEVEIFADL